MVDRLRYIHPDEIHDHWEFVKQGLIRIHDRAKDRWKPEDVYHGIKSQVFWLYLVEDNKGFVVLQPMTGWDGKELFVFAAYIVPGEKVMDAAFEEVKQLGRNMGAKRIKFCSKREGWKKRAAELGYQFSHVEFEVNL